MVDKKKLNSFLINMDNILLHLGRSNNDRERERERERERDFHTN